MTMPLRKLMIPSALSLFAGILLLCSCTPKKEKWSNIPAITFAGLGPDSVKAPSGDQVLLSFNFKDGDGNLGVKATSGQKDVYLIDSRDTQYNLSFFFPRNITEYIVAGTTISGSCNLYIPAAALELRPDHPNRDTVVYEYYIVDAAGNQSNHLKTPPIYLLAP